MATPSFYEQWGLNVETYDERTDLTGTPVEGDVDFYVREARACGGPVLELASGTGRVTFALAASGVEAVGLELSDAMLRRAGQKLEVAADPVRGRLRFEKGDMTRFDVSARFPLIIIPFRAFQALKEPAQQRDCLQSVARHLTDDGRFIVDLFDPRVERLAPGRQEDVTLRAVFAHPSTGNEVRVETVERTNEPLRQVFHEL